MKMFSVRDKKAEAFLPPFCQKTWGMAIRMFGDALDSQGHEFNKHPEDYELYCLGEYDEVTGEVVSDVESVITGFELLAQKEFEK